MESCAQLDSAGGAAEGRLILLLLLLFVPGPAPSQTTRAPADQIAELKKLYDAGRWSDVVQAVPESSDEPADLELYRGLALAQLQRWEEARKAFEAGLVRNPRDARFLVELAGIDYRENRLSRAKKELRRALIITPWDAYANDFLASIYFLQGNLEAALKYWNRTGKPKLADLTFDPQPSLTPALLDRPLAFSLGSMWSRGQFLKTRSQLESLDLFPHLRFQLVAQPDGSFDLTIHGGERNGWGISRWDGLLSLLRGLPYQTLYPEFYNVGDKGLNWLSLVRWDDEKRRVSSEVAAPLNDSPSYRYRIYFDGRNENWDLSRTLTPSILSPAHLNFEKAVVGAEIQSIVSGRLQWNSGVEYSYRRFRNLFGIPVTAAPFFTDGSAIALRSSVQRSLVRFPEERITLDSSATGEIGTFFGNPPSRYGRISGALRARWFPEPRGGDYEMQMALRVGWTFGQIPFDEVFMLGVERDNDLWMRGHPALRDGEKGNAPLGRDYVLTNWETDKIVYQSAFLTFKAGPFLDSGTIYDPSVFFGSPKWLFDTGIQAKIRVIGSFEFVLGYGKDLRSRNNSFFTTVSR